jgi:eukaryotic-like serine/threonine-protein kinase
MADDRTIVLGGAPTPQEQAEAAAEAIARLPRADHYRVSGTLASGGMGEVLIAHDVPLERNVVVKRMRATTPSAESITRFLREARIQGSLEHPSVVPVHELAVDPEGRPFFAMKQIPGTTLADVIASNRAGEVTGWTRSQLLRAFVDVCLAIELAHTRGILHRDLKPHNIALGDFGEVYVLDWGVARILGADHVDAFEPVSPDEPGPFPDDATAPPTLPGAILGTPGYMAPEQLRGDAEVGPAADIFALGCMLFEILAGEPLHPRNSPLASTVTGVDARPSQRANDDTISPELDAMCVRATAAAPEERYLSARALAGEVQRYLDGDRDLARRRALAEVHLDQARDALELGTDDGRRDAMRAAGRALALDPESREAAELVSHLVLAPPPAMPRELARELAEQIDGEVRHHSRVAMLGFGAFLAFLPMLLWIGVRDWAFFGVGYGMVAAAVAFSGWSSRMARPPRYRAWLTMLASAVLVAYFGRLIGPFLLPAGMATVAMAISANHPHLLVRPWISVVVYLVAALAPWGLELAGVLAPTYAVTGDGYLITTNVLVHEPVAGQLAIAGYIAAVIVVIGVLCMRLARLAQDTRRRAELQAWHLRQLVPAARVSARD